MVRLIVTDMDGTLLDEKHKLPADFDSVYQELQRRRIAFVMASGRSFVSLQEYYDKMPGAPACICDNGAYLIEGGKIADIHQIAYSNLHKLLQAASGIQGIHLVLCGVHGTYYLDDGSDFSHIIKQFYSNHRAAPDFSQVRDVIFKVGLSDITDPAEHSLPLLEAALGGSLSMRISGDTWVDITEKDVTKGAALRRLQERMGITPEETMAFGDNFNDIELLACAHYSFVMENAAPTMRQYARFLARSNRAHGVTAAIRQFIFI